MKYRTLGIFSILAGVSFLIINCSPSSNPSNPPSGPTNTPIPNSTNTATLTDTSTVIGTPTNTATITKTSTATNTPTLTVASTLTLTATNTATATATLTATTTVTQTTTSTPTLTATNTATATPTVTGASTPFWQLVGTAGFGAKAAYTKLLFNSDNPYVVYADTNNGNKGMVQEYTGGIWTTVGGADYTPGGASYPSAAFYNNNLYVAYTDSTEANLVTVEEYNGSSWATIGSPGFGGASGYNSLAIDPNGNIYVAFQGVNNSYLMEYNGSAWVTVGGGTFSKGTGSFVSVAFDSSNNPYVAFGDGYYGGSTVVEYASGAWTTLGGVYGSGGGSGGGGPTHVANYVDLVFNGGNPYVAYMDLSINEEDSLVEWSGSSWSNVGSAGFTPNIDAFYTTLAFSPANSNPYVSYEDTTVTDQAMVMEHTGAGTSGWVTVGSPHFSAAGTTFNSLAFDTSGDPYVAYVDGYITAGGKVTVMEYH